jgi:pyruvate-ferredoxin/flavodoxin oxidoreductase
MRYNPALRGVGKNPFQLDSRPPTIPLKQYAYQEGRYTMLARSDPASARELLNLAEEDVRRQWYEYASRAAMAGREAPQAPKQETVTSSASPLAGAGDD